MANLLLSSIEDQEIKPWSWRGRVCVICVRTNFLPSLNRNKLLCQFDSKPDLCTNSVYINQEFHIRNVLISPSHLGSCLHKQLVRDNGRMPPWGSLQVRTILTTRQHMEGLVDTGFRAKPGKSTWNKRDKGQKTQTGGILKLSPPVKFWKEERIM